jgi:hypothetical protein
MQLDRRELLGRVLFSSAAATVPATAQMTPIGIPGPYRGRVVAVAHSSSIDAGKVNRAAVREMLRRGMTELTAAPSWQDAWRSFFQTRQKNSWVSFGSGNLPSEW